MSAQVLPPGEIAPVEVDVMLFFSDQLVNMYQIRQWYAPLTELSKRHRLAVLCWDRETADQIIAESTLSVVVIGGKRAMPETLQTMRPRVVLYPNHNAHNFQMLGYRQAIHAFICHGESDKIYMSSGSVKAYNYDLIAGEAGRQRLGWRLYHYDVPERTIEVGRPQIDLPPAAPDLPDDGRITVFYAPTWEGGRPSTRVGSIMSHGRELVRRLLADDRFRLVYRAHPRSGIMLEEYGQAHVEIVEMIERANERDPQAAHLVDDTFFGWQPDACDVMITDISAVAYDWLPSGKPLLITRPADPEAIVDTIGFIQDLDLLEVERMPDIVQIVLDAMGDASLRETLDRWASYYFGDRTKGASLDRFLRGVDRMLSEASAWEREHEHDRLVSTRDVTSMSGIGGAFAQLRARGGAARLVWTVLLPARNAYRLMRHRYWKLRYRSGRDRAEQRSIESAVPNSVDVMFYMTGSTINTGYYRRWLPLVERAARDLRVGILCSNLGVYQKLKSRIDVPVFFVRRSGDAEEFMRPLGVKVMVYMTLKDRILLDAGFHDIFHVFIGAPGKYREGWRNNRLRIFDWLLLPDADAAVWFDEHLIAFPGSRFTVDVSGAVTARRQGRKTPFTLLGVDEDAVSGKLVEILRERDEAVSARDARAAAEGVVLTQAE